MHLVARPRLRKALNDFNWSLLASISEGHLGGKQGCDSCRQIRGGEQDQSKIKGRERCGELYRLKKQWNNGGSTRTARKVQLSNLRERHEDTFKGTQNRRRELRIATTQASMHFKLGILPIGRQHRHKVSTILYCVVGQWTARSTWTRTETHVVILLWLFDVPS